MKKNKLEKEILEYMKERNDMLNLGFPFCYSEGNVQLHCDTCISFFKKRTETHEIK